LSTQDTEDTGIPGYPGYQMVSFFIKNAFGVRKMAF